MTLKNQIQAQLTAAMKARDEDTKRTLRLVMTSIKLAEVESGGELDDSRILSILQKEVKTREDTMVEARSANRNDLVEAAQKELLILQKFLPQQLGKDGLKAFAQKAINEIGATGLKDMGLVMKILIPQLEGRASGQEASQVVRDLLQAK